LFFLSQIDDAFMDFLCELFGSDVVQTFKENYTTDLFDIYCEIEALKKGVKFDNEDVKKILFKIPQALLDEYKKQTGLELRNELGKNPKFENLRNKISFDKNGKVRFTVNIIQSFFKKPLDELSEHIRDIMCEPSVQGTRTVIIVGGFAESNMVQETLKAEFPNLKLIFPFEAGLAVLKGAVLFGHSPMVITTRICPNTYGIAVSKMYAKGAYPEDHVTETLDGKKIVKNVFHKYMTIGEPTKVGLVVTSLPLSVQPGQPQAQIRIFASKQPNPVFVTDSDCSYVGMILVDTPDVTDSDTVEVRMTFGGTELRVEAHENSTGLSYRARFDFLSSD